ncbi:myosin-G heavy chain isoform X2 [Ochlerotatus camptorhynchus]|uniref:myosin-G heavy chain isoform X2 n=1 Tax=Ochlerotatus camptorhynchus TaxID=644619 RepID=UPI0031D9D036
MSISCKCLNIVVKLVEPEAEHLERFDLESYLINHRNQQEPATAATTAAKATTPSDDHFLFFKEALGPVRCFNVQVQFDGLLRKERIFDEWDLSQCRYCESFVFARHMADDANTDANASAMITCLINSSLMTNEEQLSARMAGGNYSPAFGIVLNGSSLSYSDLIEKRKLLSKAKSDNQFMQRLRAYMERETEAANERIQRFTEQEFAVLKVKRERGEQDCMILAKLAAANNQVPDELLLVRSNSTSSSSNNGGQQTVAMTTAGPVSNSNGTNLNDSSANSQLETPPPTPEYLPMSTGNSPPMTTANGPTTNNRQQPITPSSSSSMVEQSPFSSSANARLNGRILNRANLSYNNANNHINNNNNNNIVSYNNSRGAINRQQPQQPTTTMMQHSSTNSLTMQQQQQQHRVASYETDCLFDIDGMENDHSPLSNTLSDEEELEFDESTRNNNEDGMCIPSSQKGRQNSSIAKSLPITIPQLMTQFRMNEEDFEETEDNVDIAASIKALARSVHGDTMFGDLPRPQIQRFSTQI